MADFKFKFVFTITYSDSRVEKKEKEWDPSSASDELELARSTHWGVSIDDDGVQDDHAELYYLNWQLYIKPDQGKVLVNGSRIRGLTPITENDTIGMGKAKLCIAIQGDPKKKLKGTYFAQIEILTKCPECGHPVPVNGLLETLHCNTCQSDFTWSGKGWKMFLEDIQSSVMTAGGMSTNYLSHGTNVEATAATPVCPSCKKSIPGEALEGCEGGSVTCPECGHAMGCGSAPKWLLQAYPNLKAVYGGEAEPEGGQAVELSSQAGKPVLFKCPGCSATLKITAGSERVTTCEFCKSDVYLPDDLWLRLHPAKKMEPWYVKFGMVQK